MKRSRATFKLALLSLGLILFLPFFNLAQCPSSLSCSNTETICDITTLDSIYCSTSDIVNDDFPTPGLCFGTGVPNNLSWLAFVGNGGDLTVDFTILSRDCQNTKGLQTGIFERNCDGSKVLDCQTNCGLMSFSLEGTTKECETYYLWVDGCEGDICTYLMEVTLEGPSPVLPRPMPALSLMDIPCIGNTISVCFPGYNTGCTPGLTWSVDGMVIPDSDSTCIEVTIPRSSTTSDLIEVCLSATVGNKNKPNTLCDSDQICYTIQPQAPAIVLEDTVHICYGDEPYSWRGMTIDSSCVNPPCSARVDGQCLDVLQPIIIHDGPAPVTLEADTFICFGDTLTLNLEGNVKDVLWNTGKNTNTIQVDSPGTYCVTAVMLEEDSCLVKICHEIIESYVWCTNTFISPDDGSKSGRIVTIIESNRPPLKYQWDNGDTTAFIENLEAGSYTLVVSNVDGCQKIVTIEVPLETAVKDQNEIKIQIWPNPANDYVSWNTSDLVDQVILFDVHGQEVMQIRKDTSMKLNDLKAGIYMVVFKQQKHMIGVRKLVVK